MNLTEIKEVTFTSHYAAVEYIRALGFQTNKFKSANHTVFTARYGRVRLNLTYLNGVFKWK